MGPEQTPAERNAREQDATRAEYERLRRAWLALPRDHPDALGLRLGARRAKAQLEALRFCAPPPPPFDWLAALGGTARALSPYGS